jgi:putative hydrolase of the HAD superfamily
MIKAVVFDLGNVLLNFDHRIIFQRLGRHVSSPDVLRWMGQKIKRLVINFETGAIDSDTFYTELHEIVRFDGLSQDDFERQWAEIFWKNEELIDLLKALSKKVTLHMISNTNALHIQYAREAFPEVFEPFSSMTLSYEIGKAKPDPEIFQRALNSASVHAEECLYFDDIRKYVASAHRLGIHAYQYVSVEGVRDVCEMYDIRI